MPLDKLLGDLSGLRSEAKNITATVSARKERTVRFEWCKEYAQRNGWAGASIDVIGSMGRKSGWKGAPTAVSTTRIMPSTTIQKYLDGNCVAHICDAYAFTAKMTGAGFAKHPTWVGGSLCAAVLVDQRAKNLPPFSALSLPVARGQSATDPIRGVDTRVELGKTREREVERTDLPPIPDFELHSSAPGDLDDAAYRGIARALDGWTGHLRAQLGIFVAWDWLGRDRRDWSAQADHTLGVLLQVRDALLGLPGTSSVPSPTRQSRPASSEPSASADAAQPRRRPKAKPTLTPDTANSPALRLATMKGEPVLRLPNGMSGWISRWLVKPHETLTEGQPVVRIVPDEGMGERQELVFISPVSGYSVWSRRGKDNHVTSRTALVHLYGGPR